MSELALWVGVWLLAAAILVRRHWRSSRGVGLVLGYAVSFGALHGLANALNLLPWNLHRDETAIVQGMRQSALAMIMFAAGAELVLRVRQARRGRADRTFDTPPAINHAGVNLYLLTGAALQLVIAPIAHGLPSITALVSTGSTLTITAIGLKCWNHWHEGRRGRVVFWILTSLLFPLVTVATQGYLGYGLTAMLMVLVFMAAFKGPSLRLITAALLCAYCGLSLYVTYMRDRADIRSVVWSGSRFGDRMSSVLDSITEFEFFDPANPLHLSRIEVRLNQNFLVGTAVTRVEAGQVPLAHGQTFLEAVQALVPRALFPEKTVTAGSGDLVATYTGFRFAKDTSVGIGQVLECYVNFGTAGVVIFFLLLGATVTVIDGAALRALWAGDVRRFTMWYVPGIALLNIGGSFVEATATAAAGLIMAVVVGGVAAALTVRRPAMAAAGVRHTATPEVSR